MNTIKKHEFVSFLVFIMMLTTSAKAQEALRNYTLEEVVPNLTTLKSGFNYSYDQNRKSKYTYSIEKGKNTFVGSTINSAILKKELGNNIINDISIRNKYRDDYQPAITELLVYADTLDLNENLWLPECKVTIRVNYIKISNSGITIKTSPLQWKKTTMTDLVNLNDEKGKDGYKGGDVKIVANKINRIFNIDTSGSDGEPVYSPAIAIDFPTYAPDNMEVHTCQSSNSQGKHSNQHNIAYAHKIIYMKWYNYNDKGWGGDIVSCDGNQTWGNGIRWDNNVIDEFKDNRIKVTLKPVWGTGGNGGQISTNNLNSIISNAKGGKTGYYIERKLGDVTYTKDSNNRVTKIDINRKEYCFHSIEATSFPLGEVTIKNNKEYFKFNIPYDNEYNQFKTKYTLKYGQEEGKEGKIETDKHYLASEYLDFALARLAITMKSYDDLTASEQKNATNKLLFLKNELQKFNENTPINSNKEIRIANLQNQLIQIENQKGLEYDMYNNPLGYRPILSLQSTMKMMDKNIENDLFLYVLGDEINKSQLNWKGVLEKAPELEKKLIVEINTQNENLTANLKNFAIVQANADKCAEGLTILNNKITEKGKELEAKAKADEKTRRLWKVGIKTLAVSTAVVATVYGQPAIGVAGYSILNSVADGVGDGKDIDKIAISTIKNFDMNGTIQGYKEGKLMKIKMDEKSQTITNYQKKFDAAEEDIKPKFNDSLTDALKQKRKEYLSRFVGEKEKIVNYGKYLYSMSVNTSYINQKLDELKDNSPELKNLAIQTQYQVALQADLFENLSENMRDRVTIMVNLQKNSEALYAVLEARGNSAKLYQPEIQLQFEKMKESAADRIKNYEYQLVKTLEYTTMKRYDFISNRTNFDLAMKNYQNQTDKSIEEKVALLKNTYLNLFTDIKQSILNSTTTNHKQDKNGMGRRIVFNDKSSQKLIEQLNTTTHLSIDLQADLNDEIVKPIEANTRILKIILQNSDFQLDRILNPNERVEIIVTLDDKSILRSKDQFYKIDDNRSGIDTQVRDTWKWTISNVNGKNTISNSSEPSENYKTIIKEALGSNTKASELFTLHPAWTKINISYVPFVNVNYTNSVPKINSLTLTVNCDYEDSNLTTEGKSIFDLKLNNAVEGTSIILKTGDNQEHCRVNTYRILPKNSKVTLELKSPSNENLNEKIFSHWFVSNIFNENDVRLKSKTITIDLTDNVRVQPVFSSQTNPNLKLNSN
jgi:hypothetical protein